ncbi:MAG: CHASE domain-containing protein [Candidatus Microsaccharimonas sp.]
MKITLSIELPEKLSRRARLFGIVLILFCMLFTVYITTVFLRMNQRTVSMDMEITISQVLDTFRKRIEGYTDVLYTGRALFYISPNATQANWEAYVNSQSVAERFPGLSSIVYVDSNDKSRGPFVSLTFPDSAQYLKDRTISNQSIKQALAAASISGQPIASGPFHRQSTNDDRGRVSMILALYDSTYNPAMTDEQKITATRGYVLTTLLPDSIFEESLKNVANVAPVSISVKDQDDRIIFERTISREHMDDTTSGKRTLDVGGRTWRIEYAVPEDYNLTFVEKHTPVFVIIGGTILMIIVVSLYFYRKGLVIKIRRSDRFTITKRRRSQE